MKTIIFGTHDKRLELNTNIHPKPVKKVMPDYLKKIKIDKQNSNFKSCPSYIDVFKYGYALLAPCDLNIKILKNGTLNWQTGAVFQTTTTEFDIHRNAQFVSYAPENSDMKAIIKYNYPFKVFTPRGYSCRQIPLPLQYNNEWEVFEGILRTDKIHHVHLQLIIKTHNNILIEQGTPLAVFVPFKRDKFKSKIININSNNKYGKKYNKEYLKYYGKFKPNYIDEGYFK